MTEKLKQIIKEEVMKLPKEAQEAINSLEWGNIAEEIGKKFLLNESEINDFQVETLLVLVGIEDENYYAQNIENEVGTSKNEAEKMAEEVNQKIFTPINNFFIEHIKKSEKIKNPNLEQSLDFILSGGDYSAFLENSPLEEYSRGEVDNPPRLSATPKEGNKEEIVIPVFPIKG